MRVLLLLVLLPILVHSKNAKCKPNQMLNSAAIILDSNVDSASLLDSYSGSCACQYKKANAYTRSFYKSETSNIISSIPEPTIDLNCTDMSQICVVGTNKVGYKALGTLTGLKLYSFCKKPKKCKIYALPICATAGDKKSGLKGGGKKLTCAKAAKQTTLKKLIKVLAVSCSPCKKNPIKKAKCFMPLTLSTSLTTTKGVTGGVTGGVTTTKGVTGGVTTGSTTKGVTGGVTTPSVTSPSVTIPLNTNQQMFLDGQNSHRQQLANGQAANNDGTLLPQATNMYKLKYNLTIEAAAQAWSQTCVFAHSMNPLYGESIYSINVMTTGGVAIQVSNATAIQGAIASWRNELAQLGTVGLNLTQANFNRGIGHWTQLAWANSNSVGCGFTWCPNVPMTFVVCNYSPPGNIFNQNIYTAGPVCSGCPSGSSCETATGLCV